MASSLCIAGSAKLNRKHWRNPFAAASGRTGDILMRALSILMAGLLSLAMLEPAMAAPKEKEKESAGETGKEIARSIELGALVFPVFDEKGMLRNYLFVDARMLVADGKDPWKYREQSHMIRDALLRAAHRKSFHLKGDFTKLDEKLAVAECISAANAAVGEAGALVEVKFTQINSQGRN
jgi:hypothetical protein